MLGCLFGRAGSAVIIDARVSQDLREFSRFHMII